MKHIEKDKYKLYVKSSKNDTNELTYKIETGSQTQKRNTQLLKGIVRQQEEQGQPGVWDQHVINTLCKTDK